MRHDAGTGGWMLDPGFDTALGAMLLAVLPNGRAQLFDASGRLCAEGPIALDAPLPLQRDDGAPLWLEPFEIGAVTMMLVSEPLVAGSPYLPFRTTAQPILRCGPGDPAKPALLGASAMVATAEGALPVEWLRPGDRVLTRDNGFQPLLCLARVEYGAPTPPPFLLPADALGPHLPERPLLLAPWQRVLLAAPELQFWFGESEMFARADALVEAFQIARQAAPAMQRLFALICAVQEVIQVDRLWLETAEATPEVLAALAPAARATVTGALAARRANPARITLAPQDLAMFLRPPGADWHRAALLRSFRVARGTAQG